MRTEKGLLGVAESLFYRRGLAQALGVEPNPQAVVSLWQSESEDLLMLAGSNQHQCSNLQLLSELFSRLGRFERCTEELTANEPLQSVIAQLTAIVNNATNHQKRSLIDGWSPDCWVEAANKLAEAVDKEITNDHSDEAADLLEWLDDAELLLALCGDVPEALEKRRSTVECRVWMADNFDVLADSSAWVHSVAGTFRPLDQLEAVGLIESTEKFVMLLDHSERFFDSSSEVQFDGLSTEDFALLLSATTQSPRIDAEVDAMVPARVIGKLVVRPSDFFQQSATALDLTLAAGTEETEEARRLAKEVPVVNSVEIAARTPGVLSLYRIEREYAFHYRVATDEPPPTIAVRTVNGGWQPLQWNACPGGNTHGTHPPFTASDGSQWLRVTADETLEIQLIDE